MLELFRYIEQTYRVDLPDEPLLRIGGQESDFQAGLQSAREGEAPARAMAELAAGFEAGERFVSSPDTLEQGSRYRDLLALVRYNLDQQAESFELRGMVAQIFGLSPEEFIRTDSFLSDRTRLDDSLLAIKLAGVPEGTDLDGLLDSRRGIALAELAADMRRASGPAEVREFLALPFSVPADLLPPAPKIAPPSDPEPDPKTEQISGLVEKVERLNAAYHGLLDSPTAEIRLSVGASGDIDPLRPAAAARVVGVEGLDINGLALATENGNPQAPDPRFLNTRQPRTEPASHGATQLFLTPQAVQRLSEPARAGLGDLQIDLALTSLPQALEQVRSGLSETYADLFEAATQPGARIYRLGSSLLSYQPAVQTPLAASPGAAELNLADFSQTQIKPLSLGKLQVVRQELRGYELSEVSHIENVLRGESFARSTERTETTETITINETETTRGEERDLQSTDRNELSQEARSEAQQAGTSSSANMTSSSYGTLVEGSESKFSKEVTDRAVNRVTERVREQRIQRMQRIYTERTSHEFSAQDNQANITGIYQWVNKKYRTRVYNYGQRLLFDVVVPEPAAFLIHSLQTAQQAEGVILEKPQEPRFIRVVPMGGGLSLSITNRELVPSDITPGSYLQYAARYGVTGQVEPPPDEFKIVQWTASAKGTLAFLDAKITIPDGYAAVSGFMQSTNYFNDNGDYENGRAEVTLSTYHLPMDVLGRSFKMNDERGDLPITFSAGGVKGYNVAVGVVCRPLRAYQRWQLKTFAAIIEGYKRQLAAYEEKLNQVQAVMRAQMALAANYAHDPTVERTELKKAFLHLLMSEHYAKVALPAIDPLALPKDVKTANRWAAVVAFFERAFEWENMMYVYYPYFWGRQARWGELVLIQDISPQFQEFLKAGAARVVVPIRPGYEGALAHYSDTGEIWFGKKMPDMFSEMYVSIIAEMRARNAVPGEETCVEEWEITLPTTLVRLKDDDNLPEWILAENCEPDV